VLSIESEVKSVSIATGRARPQTRWTADEPQCRASRRAIDARSNRRRTYGVRLPDQSEDALDQGIARGRSAVSIVRATCPLSLGGCVEMGAITSQHATSIDFRRRCVACAATPRQASKQGGHTQRRNSMTVAAIATPPSHAPPPDPGWHRLSAHQDNEGNDHAGPNIV